MTLLYAVPVELGAAHQGGALTLFTLVICMLHTLRGRGAGAGAARPGLRPHIVSVTLLDSSALAAVIARALRTRTFLSTRSSPRAARL